MRPKSKAAKSSKYLNVNVSFLKEDYELLLRLQGKLQAKTPFGKVSIASTIRAAIEAMAREIEQQTQEQ